jgi:hypothetical protein
MMGLIVNFLGGTLKGWIGNRSEIEKRKAVARIENVSKGIPGYSDEYLIFVWSYPFVASFVPALQPSVTAGFDFMATMPDWYVATFMSLSFAVFGIDKLFRYKKND